MVTLIIYVLMTEILNEHVSEENSLFLTGCDITVTSLQVLLRVKKGSLTAS